MLVDDIPSQNNVQHQAIVSKDKHDIPPFVLWSNFAVLQKVARHKVILIYNVMYPTICKLSPSWYISRVSYINVDNVNMDK